MRNLFVILFLVLMGHSLSAQEVTVDSISEYGSVDTIQIVRLSKSIMYLKDGIELNRNTFPDVLSVCPPALEDYRLYKSYNNSAFFVGAGGLAVSIGVLVGDHLAKPSSIGLEKANRPYFIAGLCLAGVSIPFLISANYHLGKAVKVYNASVLNGENQSTSLRIGFGLCNEGVGLKLMF